MSAIHFDPRAKLGILFLCVLSTMFAPSLTYGLLLVLLIGVLGFLMKKYHYTFLGIGAYVIIFFVTKLSIYNLSSIWQAMFMAFFGLVNKVYPCGFMAGIMIATTKTSEFMAALYKMHMPNGFVIPFAVMMCYLPVIKEDWHSIKDAMRMRDISPSLLGIIKHPSMTIECFYVPMMMAASKTADELSIASVTRGIENPNTRSCLTDIRFSILDTVAILLMFLYFVFGLLLRGGML